MLGNLLGRLKAMVCLIAAFVMSAQSEAVPTETDRDVLTAYIFSERVTSTSRPDYYVIHSKTIGQPSKLCLEALNKHLSEKPELATFLKGLTERNSRELALDSLTWDTKIFLCDLFEKDHPLALGTNFHKLFGNGISAFALDLPAYSSDGKSAAVISWIGPNHIHSVYEVAILELKNKSWSVVWRQLAYSI